MHIHYTVVPCTLGYVLVGATKRGICSVTLGDTAEELESQLWQHYPAAQIHADDGELDTVSDSRTQQVIDECGLPGSEEACHDEGRHLAAALCPWLAHGDVFSSSARSLRGKATDAASPTTHPLEERSPLPMTSGTVSSKTPASIWVTVLSRICRSLNSR